MPTSLRVLILAAASLVLVPGGTGAWAQQISPEVVRGTSVGGEAQSAIKALVDGQKGGLTGDDAAIRRSRNALIEPLRTSGVSVEFRTAYSSALKSVIEPLIVHQQDAVAVSALAIAGELGTRDGLDLLARGLQDKRAGVRVRAALGYARTFVTCRDGTPALIPNQVDIALRALSTAMKTEADPSVLDSLAAGFESAMQIPDARVEGARAKATDMLATGASDLTRRLGATEAVIPVQIRVTRAMFELLRDAQVSLAPEINTQCAGAAGDTLAALLKRVDAGNISEGERASMSLLATQSERVIITAGSRMNAPLTEGKLGDMLAKSEDDRFKTEVIKVIGAGGVLCSAPFNFKADRFAK